MAEPIQGSAKAGAVPLTRPILVAGLDSDGKVRPIKVDASGVIQVAD